MRYSTYLAAGTAALAQARGDAVALGVPAKVIRYCGDGESAHPLALTGSS